VRRRVAAPSSPLKGPPVYVVLPPRPPLRFCVAGGSGDCLGGGDYIYWPGGCGGCPTISASVSKSADQLRYQLAYDEVNDEFVLTEEDGSIWRLLKANSVAVWPLHSLRPFPCQLVRSVLGLAITSSLMAMSALIW
jgi:hypothetical protein